MVKRSSSVVSLSGDHNRELVGFGAVEMKVDSWKCDGCGIPKKEVNHWFKAYKLFQALGVVVIGWDVAPPVEEVENFEAHLCGADCVTKWVSTNLL